MKLAFRRKPSDKESGMQACLLVTANLVQPSEPALAAIAESGR
jgi:hypothetical protein